MANIFSKIRFLPVTIFFAALLLTVKINEIWDGVGSFGHGSIQFSRAQAQTKETSPKEPSEGTPADQQADKKKNDEPEEKETESKAPEKANSNPDISNEKEVSRLVTNDPTLLSPAEIELLQQLAVRRDNLDARENELQAREGLLNAAEERIDKKIIDLQNLRLTIDSLIKKFNTQQDTKLKSLVKIYENMKPKSAAAIFEQLEMDTLLEVAEHMKERKLAAIMAQLGQERAREITVELRRLRELPKFGGQVGG